VSRCGISTYPEMICKPPPREDGRSLSFSPPGDPISPPSTNPSFLSFPSHVTLVPRLLPPSGNDPMAGEIE